ncbi:hypothetical protein ACA910_010789 [Epithemia clementina (nom. ined.)]
MVRPSAVLSILLYLVALATGLIVRAGNNHAQGSKAQINTCRREALTSLIASSVVAVVGQTSPAHAFGNKISTKYDDRPKRRGPTPKDLGVAMRTTMTGDDYLGLKECGPAPNCFSSTIPLEEDPDHSIPSWTWPAAIGNDKSKAFAQLHEVLLNYPPGQNGVDGGGFEIQKFDPENGYIYVIFEALKNGYFDDVEFACIGNGSQTREIQVRSSSRVGYLDYGVNAKRLNWIAAALRAKGWNAVGVDIKTHQGYASENQM